jgi:hypothetical protein
MNVTTLGIDLAKNIFQLHGVNKQGNIALQRHCQLIADSAQLFRQKGKESAETRGFLARSGR